MRRVTWQHSECITRRELLLSLRATTEGNIWLQYWWRSHSLRPPWRKRGRMKCCLDNWCGLLLLPALFNTGIEGKMDGLESWAKFKQEIKECCLLGISEMWLNESDMNSFSLDLADQICTPETALLCISQTPILFSVWVLHAGVYSSQSKCYCCCPDTCRFMTEVGFYLNDLCLDKVLWNCEQ